MPRTSPAQLRQPGRGGLDPFESRQYLVEVDPRIRVNGGRHESGWIKREVVEVGFDGVLREHRPGGRRGHFAAAVPESAASIEPAQPRCCPNCGGQRLVYGELEPIPEGSAPMAATTDSS
jgi:hypothetical protein